MKKAYFLDDLLAPRASRSAKKRPSTATTAKATSIPVKKTLGLSACAASTSAHPTISAAAPSPSSTKDAVDKRPTGVLDRPRSVTATIGTSTNDKDQIQSPATDTQPCASCTARPARTNTPIARMRADAPCHTGRVRRCMSVIISRCITREALKWLSTWLSPNTVVVSQCLVLARPFEFAEMVPRAGFEPATT